MTGDAATEAFTEHRGLLIGVAYRILGEVGEAEDIVQEAWLRWASVDPAEIRDPKAFLVKVTTRLAIDRLRSARARRESYVGPWLPEPMLTGPDNASEGAMMAESVSLAMLVVLESLSPLERAVFVLREVFGYGHAEIGEVLGKSEAAVRQLARRARDHVASGQARYESDDTTRRDVTERFLEVTMNGDLKSLLDVLAPDVELVTDGGGLVRAARRIIKGPEKAARALVSFTRPENFARYLEDAGLPRDAPFASRMETVNGGPALVLTAGGRPIAVLQLDVDADGMIRRVYSQGNPEKLARL